MKRQVLSEKGDWSQWTNQLKMALESSHNNRQIGEKIVFENEDVRVWSIHLPAKQSLPFHKHANPYFWTAMSEGISRSYYDDGSIAETEYRLGDTKYFKGLDDAHFFIHNLENIGSTTLIFSTVEFLNKK